MILFKTLTAAGAGLLMQVGAGCFAPTVLVDDGETVALKYGRWESTWEVQGRAEALCAAHGKAAVLREDVAADLEPDFRRATFDCVAGEEPLT